MTDPRRVNPLKHDALTISTIRHGDQIIYWCPGDPSSTHHVTIDGGVYTNADDDLVIDVVHRDGHITTELTSTVGLTGQRHDGKWVAIAIADEETDSEIK